MPPTPNGRDVLVLYNQGLGETELSLFCDGYLNCARARCARDLPQQPEARAAPGAPLTPSTNWCPKLKARPCRTMRASRTEQYACLVDHFPLALGEGVAGEVAPSLRIDPEPTRVAALRERLAAVGPAPYIGVTWRGGTAPSADGKHENLIRLLFGSAVRTKALYKEVPLADCAHVLGGVRGTLIALQRKPGPWVQLRPSPQRQAATDHFTACNDDLENMLALVSLLDDYVCVSNTNVHLRAAAGLPSRVLIPFPSPDWRWDARGRRESVGFRQPYLPAGRHTRLGNAPRHWAEIWLGAGVGSNPGARGSAASGSRLGSRRARQGTWRNH